MIKVNLYFLISYQYNNKFMNNFRIIMLPIISVVIQFIFLFTSSYPGGMAMAPFVFVPYVLGVFALLFIINIILKFININIDLTINSFIFLLTFTSTLIFNDGFSSLSSLFKNNNEGEATRLMYLPALFATAIVIIYDKRKIFLS